MEVQSILLTAGGTGGHVIPAVTLANCLVQKRSTVTFVTDRRGEAYLKDLNPKIIKFILPMGARKNIFKFLYDLCHCQIKALIWMVQTMPHKVVGFGGFPSFPCLLAGLLTGRTLMVHEQNTVLGRTNTWFYPFLKKLFLTFPIKGYKKSEVVGLPLRPGFEYAHHPAPNNKHLNLLIMGGSQGASYFTSLMQELIPTLPQNFKSRLKVTHQAPEKDLAALETFYASHSIPTRLAPFFDDMPAILQASNLMIARAGASTVMESIATHTPAIFIPLPIAMHDHQTQNALYVVEHLAGWMVPQNDLTSLKVQEIIEKEVNNLQDLERKGKRLENLSKKNVTESLASLIQSV